MDDVRPYVLASLDHRTKLARGRWRLVLYPDAGEAVATFQSAAGHPRSFGTAQPASDAAQVAARRARKQVRLYCASNRLAYLWTATYAPTEDARHQPRLVRQDVRHLFRRLRTDLGRAFPYLWTTEWHSTGHGLHVHFAVGERVDHATVRSAWRRGHVWVSAPTRGGRGDVEDARRVARYIAKYLAKDHQARDGLHRYEVAQGFQPRSRVLFGATAEAALFVAVREMGAAPARYWESRQVSGWSGPPAVWAAWE
jgi:hypothetical protein